MFLGLVTVLDGKLGAPVQTAQAHDTVFLGPGGLTANHLNGIYRAVLGAESTADAGILRMKVTGFAQSLIETGVDHFHKLTQLVIDMVAFHTYFDLSDDTFHFFVGLGICFRNLVRVGEIKYRSPVVGHLHGVHGIEGASGVFLEIFGSMDALAPVLLP